MTRGLLNQHLEDISSRVLEDYGGVIKNMIRRRSGVYALYRRGKLYYVGLASDLMWRLRSHIKDRHRGAWDRFSVYLTADSEHVKELESLLLRIVNPVGNKVSGHFKGSTNLFSALNNRIKELDAERRASLLGAWVARRLRRRKVTRGRGNEALAGFSDRSLTLRAQYKDKRYRARLRRDGSIRYDGRVYDSPTAAARKILHRHCNGWWFWRYKNPDGQWVRLVTLRK